MMSAVRPQKITISIASILSNSYYPRLGAKTLRNSLILSRNRGGTVRFTGFICHSVGYVMSNLVINYLIY